MTRTIPGLALAAIALAGPVLLGPAVPRGAAQPPPADDKKEKPDGVSGEPSDMRRAAEKLVGTIELEVQTGDKWSKVKRLDKPLLLYSDNTRDNDRGSVWAWGEQGRPLALFEMFQKVGDRTIWVVGMCNTSGRKLRAGRAGEAWWRENDSAIEFKDVPATPPVAADPAARQRQLKLLAQKFTAHEVYNRDNTRYDLRRLERPLRTYRDEPAGVAEGGLFTFANGTNPEVMLFVEARTQKGTANPVWQYGVGRTAFAELHLQYDGKEVFSAPNGKGLSGPDKPFWASVLESDAR